MTNAGYAEKEEKIMRKITALYIFIAYSGAGDSEGPKRL